MVKKNACIFISGKGSNLKNLIKKTRDYNFPINIKLVISNNKNAQGINYAKINWRTCCSNLLLSHTNILYGIEYFLA